MQPLTVILMAMSCGFGITFTQYAPGQSIEKDLLHAAIDPLLIGDQRGAFIHAAGVDSELTESEFSADKDARNGFARTFDTWPAILLFDNDQNRMIDWLEASDYRLTLRDRLLLQHDSNRNKRLEGSEREAALNALSTVDLCDYLRASITPKGPPKINDVELKENNNKPSLRDLSRRIRDRHEQALALIASEKEPWLSDDDETRLLATDGLFLTDDHDGDGATTKKDWELFGKRLRQRRRKDCERAMVKALAKYDINHNGILDPAEAAESLRWNEMFMKKFCDRNQDGVVDSDRLDHPAFLSWKERLEFDDNRNGLLEDNENEALYRRHQLDGYLEHVAAGSPHADINRLYALYRSEHWTEFDLDQDGEINDNELVSLHASFTRESRGLAPIPKQEPAPNVP